MESFETNQHKLVECVLLVQFGNTICLLLNANVKLTHTVDVIKGQLIIGEFTSNLAPLIVPH